MSFQYFTELIDIDIYIEKIKAYNSKFHVQEEFFIQCKNEENFERNVRRDHLEHSYRICSIYGNGRDTIITIISLINEYTDYSQHQVLKNVLDTLSNRLSELKNMNIQEYESVEALCEELKYYEWSVSSMIKELKKVDAQLDEILSLIELLKTTATYRYQNKEITMEEIKSMNEQHNIQNNFNGTFSETQIAVGNHNTNTMNINNTNDELSKICAQMLELINQSNETQEVQAQLNTLVKGIQEAKDKSSLKQKYNDLIGKLSNHITVFSAIGASGLLQKLSQFL
jgi:hypothetical protein